MAVQERQKLEALALQAKANLNGNEAQGEEEEDNMLDVPNSDDENEDDDDDDKLLKNVGEDSLEEMSIGEASIHVGHNNNTNTNLASDAWLNSSSKFVNNNNIDHPSVVALEGIHEDIGASGGSYSLSGRNVDGKDNDEFEHGIGDDNDCGEEKRGGINDIDDGDEKGIAGDRMVSALNDGERKSDGDLAHDNNDAVVGRLAGGK